MKQNQLGIIQVASLSFLATTGQRRMAHGTRIKGFPSPQLHEHPSHHTNVRRSQDTSPSSSSWLRTLVQGGLYDCPPKPKDRPSWLCEWGCNGGVDSSLDYYNALMAVYDNPMDDDAQIKALLFFVGDTTGVVLGSSFTDTGMMAVAQRASNNEECIRSAFAEATCLSIHSETPAFVKERLDLLSALLNDDGTLTAFDPIDLDSSTSVDVAKAAILTGRIYANQRSKQDNADGGEEVTPGSVFLVAQLVNSLRQGCSSFAN